MNKCIIATLLALAVSVCACKSPSGDSSTAQKAVPVAADEGYQAFTKRFQALTSTIGAWKDVKLPVTLRLSSPQSVTLSGQATLIRGKWLNISIRFLGMEMGGLSLTPDSIFAYEKLHKHYLAESIPRLLNGFPATLANLQDLLTGRPFFPGIDRISGADANLFRFADVTEPGLTDHWSMSIDDARLLGAFATWIVNGDKKPSVDAIYIGFSDDSSRRCSLIYSDRRQTPAGNVPGEVLVEVVLHKMNIDAAIEWGLSKAKWNTGVTVAKRMPSGYSRVSASELIKMFGSF